MPIVVVLISCMFMFFAGCRPALQEEPAEATPAEENMIHRTQPHTVVDPLNSNTYVISIMEGGCLNAKNVDEGIAMCAAVENKKILHVVPLFKEGCTQQVLILTE